jgi:cell division protein FtsB
MLPIAAYLSFAASQSVITNYQVQQETKELREQLANANLEKQKLEALIVYYKTDAFKEKELRRALLLARSDEKVYALPESFNAKNLEEMASDKQENITTLDKGMSNVELWVTYLF